MDETRPEQAQRQWGGAQPDEASQALIEQLAGLELGKQLQILRAVVPELMARLSPEDRRAFAEQLAGETVH